MGKNCALGLEYGRTQDEGHSFFPYRPTYNLGQIKKEQLTPSPPKKQ